jgi:uncharacterized membrane protein
MGATSVKGSAIGLGWFSVGLGLGALVAPRALARAIGVRPRARACSLLRAVGAREVAAGVGLLGARRRSAPWLWARVAGDVIDLALLGAALRSARAKSGRVLGAMGAVAGVAACDVLAALGASHRESGHALEPVRRSVTIARTPSQVYRFWRDLQNLPAFMLGLESVEVLDAHRSRWRARGPVGPVVEWEVILIDDVEDQLIRWSSTEGSPVRTDGVVTFRPAPGRRGTEVHLEVAFAPGHGAVGRAVAALSGGVIGTKLEADLGRCKQLLETGHITHSDASVHAGPHPARPSADLKVPS